MLWDWDLADEDNSHSQQKTWPIKLFLPRRGMKFSLTNRWLLLAYASGFPPSHSCGPIPFLYKLWSSTLHYSQP